MSEALEYSLEDKLPLIQSRIDIHLWEHWKIEWSSRDLFAKERLIATHGLEDCTLMIGEQYGKDVHVLRVKGKVCLSTLEEGTIGTARFLDERGNRFFRCDVIPSSVTRLDFCIRMHPTNAVKMGMPLLLNEVLIPVEAIVIPESWGV